jgi:hypothetical protein
MSSLAVEIQEPRAKSVQVSGEGLTVDLVDGRTIVVPLGWFPRLWHGTPQERNDLEITLTKRSSSLIASTARRTPGCTFGLRSSDSTQVSSKTLTTARSAWELCRDAGRVPASLGLRREETA